MEYRNESVDVEWERARDRIQWKPNYPTPMGTVSDIIEEIDETLVRNGFNSFNSFNGKNIDQWCFAVARRVSVNGVSGKGFATVADKAATYECYLETQASMEWHSDVCDFKH